ncbi:DUF4148 domain-containing protein [Burkholderia multivorans]|uniref:DUF4148 domain-containing protein n=1 Tax=Burkholderia multivorans TaxID=87883 RepID=UPI000A87D5D3
MKTALSLLVAAAPIAAPLVSFGSFAQPANGPVTRAEVVAQLSQSTRTRRLQAVQERISGRHAGRRGARR